MDEMKALSILKLLADGIDPETGEVLPADSLLQRPDVVRALTAACGALEVTTERSEGGLCKAGEPWSRADERKLLAAFERGAAVPELARELGRTVGAIRARLGRFGRFTQ